MRVVSLGSGSSGNALLVEAGPHGRTKLLIDAGLNGNLLRERLRRVGVQASQLQGVLVTHEHSDHVIGLPSLMKRYAIPVIADPRTYKALEDSLISGAWRMDSGVLISALENDVRLQGALTAEFSAANNSQIGIEEQIGIQESEAILQCAEDAGRMLALPVGTRRVIGDIEVTSFPISHDAVAPCGYLLSAGGCRVCLVTDSGEVTPEMLAVIGLADLLILESNHDRQRLLRGPYPLLLKQRILSSTGHLSNDQAADAVLRTWRLDSVRWLWLAHLSRTNNTPRLALKGVRDRLQAAGANLAQIHISTLPPDMGSVWDSTQLWHTSSLWEMPS
jgi:phosphoribosyl 1,2-cyclic phosphodiesterase